MVKNISGYRCKNCDFYYAKWAGKCSECGTWGSVEPDHTKAYQQQNSIFSKMKGEIIEFADLLTETRQTKRKKTGILEFDRVLGGGIATSSSVLLSGDPGIGKSTLLLQVANSFSGQGGKVIYISGEEATDQIIARAKRLGYTNNSQIKIGSETDLNNILTTIENETIDLLVIDSIQTIYSEQIESAPGSINQVKACVLNLSNLAKKKSFSIIFVGHVTKDGQIAGPKLVEHMVDTVINFESEKGFDFRILRSVKNRFGASNEIGVFEMTAIGLKEIKNPSELFLSERSKTSNGSVVFAALEGTRPVLVEVQALVSSSSLATAKRTVVGLDSSRISMILAVLEARCGKSFVGLDVFLNVAGGIRISEPAADLAVALALMSAINEVIVPNNAVVFGELSLSGGLRQVTQSDTRIKEAKKLGFSSIILPRRSKTSDYASLTLQRYDNITEVTHKNAR